MLPKSMGNANFLLIYETIFNEKNNQERPFLKSGKPEMESEIDEFHHM